MSRKRPRVLKPTNFKPFKRVVFAFDIETSDNNTHAYMICVYGKDYQQTFYSREAFFEALKHRRFRNCWMIASNLRFDLLTLISRTTYEQHFNLRWRGSSSGLLMARTFISEKGFRQFKSQDNRHAKSITFIDTYNYITLSVDKMGGVVGVPKMTQPSFVPKGEAPQSREEWLHVKLYCMRDAEITYKFFHLLVKGFDILGVTLKPTVAASAMTGFTNNALKKLVYLHSKKQLRWQFEGYYGGRTECFQRGNIQTYLQSRYIKQLYMYDINSLYPSVMRDYEFPDPNSLKVTHHQSLHYIQDFEGMSDVTITAPKQGRPFLPKKHDHKLLFPRGSWRAKYCHNELRYALSLGYVITDIHETYYFTNTWRPFTDLINTIYQLRLEYQKDKNPLELVCKLIMNSLYGKFAQRFFDREEFRPVPHDIAEFEAYEHFKIIDMWGTQYMKVTGIETAPAPFCMPIIAAYITSYARIRMYPYIESEHTIYTDTDCIMTPLKMDTSSELGRMKLEASITQGYIVRPKFYGIEGHKASGAPLKKYKLKGYGSHLTQKIFNEILEKGCIAHLTRENGKHLTQKELNDILEGCKVKYSKFAALKEAHRLDIPVNSIMAIQKLFSLEDTKQHWEDVYNSQTWQVSTPLSLTFSEDIKNKLHEQNDSRKSNSESYTITTPHIRPAQDK